MHILLKLSKKTKQKNDNKILLCLQKHAEITDFQIYFEKREKGAIVCVLFWFLMEINTYE